MVDELIDRFGEPPEAVRGLIDIALLRNTAMSLGIYEIKQQERLLLLYTNTLDIQIISKMGAALKGQVVFGTGSRPYIGIKTPSGAPPARHPCRHPENYAKLPESTIIYRKRIFLD